FAWSSHLDRHMRTHIAAGPAGEEEEEEEGVEAEEEPPPATRKCADCGKSLNHQTDPQRFKHKGTQTPLADPAPQPHRCEQCGKYFTHSSALLKHRQVHGSERLHPCPDCPRRFRCSTALAKHRCSHTQPPKNAADATTPAIEKAAKPYPCGACGKSFG
ncbi:ZNF99 protein, partial [Certhia familiaris]|nr:ZNF99 protein [Certhia familiaris]